MTPITHALSRPEFIARMVELLTPIVRDKLEQAKLRKEQGGDPYNYVGAYVVHNSVFSHQKDIRTRKA